MPVYRIAPAALLAAALCTPFHAQAADAPAGAGAQSQVQPQGQSASAASSLIAAAEAQLAEGKVDEAVATLTQAVAADPSSSLAHTRLGGAKILKQEYSAAIRDFRNALAADPNNADAFVGMAVAYLHSGDHALARAALGEAKRLAPAKGPEIDKVLDSLDRGETGDVPPGL